MGINILMIATGLYRMLLGHTNYLIRSDMSLGWNVRGVKCTWGETYVGWNVRGVKRTWGEMYVGWNVRGVKCTWGEMYVGWNVPGWNVPGWNVFGVKCHVTVVMYPSPNFRKPKIRWGVICANSWKPRFLKTASSTSSHFSGLIWLPSAALALGCDALVEFSFQFGKLNHLPPIDKKQW